MPGKALLIGLDGATFTILDPLIERGLMPRLADLRRRGISGPLRSFMPPLTPPGWTSLMTGRPPGEHGVFDFLQKDGPSSTYFRFASSDDVHVPTIWSLASDAGRRVIALNFPMMFPPPEVRGSVVPGGWMPWRQLRLGCHPPDLFDRLRALPSFNPRELALDIRLEEKAVEGCSDEEYAAWIALHIRRERHWCDVLEHLVATEPADLIGIVFDGVDKLQHLCWRFLDPAVRPAGPSPWYREIADLCDAYFRQLDALIGAAIDLAGPDTTVVVASDHGAGPTTEIFCVNTWLEREGFLAWAEPDGVATDDQPELGFRQLARHVYQLDWSRTVAYAATPSSQGIHIAAGGPGGEPALDPARYRRIRRALADRLRALRHPATGRAVVEEVRTREEVFAGPYESLAPDLSFTLADGAVASILRTDAVFKRRSTLSGSHRWDGIFVASGPSLRQGVRLDGLSILGVAPLLLRSLGLPTPAEMRTRVPAAAFAAEAPGEALAVASAARAERQRGDGSRAGDVAVADIGQRVDLLTAEEEDAVFRRLQRLGYLE